MRYWLVMPAAGASERFGGPTPKQYTELAGRTVIEWSLAPFLDDERCAGAVVALAAHDSGWAPVAARLRASLAGAAAAISTCTGGAQRCLSVRRALATLAARAAPEDWVLVHDAARPCLERGDLERLLAALAAHPEGGLLAAPVADTLKRGAPGDAAAPAVLETVDRTALWRALTPQMFRYGKLCAALDAAQAAGRHPSDEAQALEWLGARPLLIAGSPTNLKITDAAELALAAAILQARRS
jgi:2-C-methyl-D-erythritol 4-phosphate cytidylyltransferase